VEEALTWYLEQAPWAEPPGVLTSTGAFVDQHVHYFEPDRTTVTIDFDLKAEVAYAEVRAYLLDLTWQPSRPVLCLRNAYTGRGGRGVEWLVLLAREFGGTVWCYDTPPSEAGIHLSVTYEPDRRTGNLERLLAFCRARARFLPPELG
jgi:hypothetical protein